jgi:hypothetical protein
MASGLRIDGHELRATLPPASWNVIRLHVDAANNK